MYRREFLKSAATTTLSGAIAAGSSMSTSRLWADESQVDPSDPQCCRTYATLSDARQAPPEDSVVRAGDLQRDPDPASRLHGHRQRRSALRGLWAGRAPLADAQRG